MIASLDSLSKVVYIQLEARKRVYKTVEFGEWTVLELDQNNQLLAIEMIKPSRVVLKRIAEKYERAELARIDLKSLQNSIN